MSIVVLPEGGAGVRCALGRSRPYDQHRITHRADFPRGAALLDCLSACYASFRERLAGAEQVWTCRCTACSRVDGLDLKFVLHAGSYVVQSIAGGRELVGPEVVMAHRLLKNHAAELIGHSAYALIAEEEAARLAVPADGARELTVTYEHYSPIAVRVYALR